MSQTQADHSGGFNVQRHTLQTFNQLWILRGVVFYLLFSWSSVASAQDTNPSSLPAGTVIKVQITRSVVSGRVRIGDYIPFKVIEETKVGDRQTIAKDTVVFGRVVDRKHRFTFFKKGMVGIAIDSIKAADGTMVPVYITRPNPDVDCKDKLAKHKPNPKNETGVIRCVRGRVYAGSFTNALPSAIIAAGTTTALVLIKDSTAQAAAAVTLAGQLGSQPGLSLILNGADAEIDNGEIFDAVVLPAKKPVP